MKLTFALAALAAFGSLSTSLAQERTAAGALATQITWSALSTQISAVKTQTEAVNTRVDQVVVCGRKSMVYGPGVPGADADGCLTPATASTVISQITNLQTSVNGNAGCGAQGRVFNGQSCVTPASSAPSVSCRIETGQVLTQGGQPRGCPAGFTEGFGRTVGITTTYCVRAVCN